MRAVMAAFVAVAGISMQVQAQPARPARPPLAAPQEMNVIDQALFVLAEHYMYSGRDEQAVIVLTDVAKATPDAETRSYARYNAGVILEERLASPSRAREQFAHAAGIMGASARRRVVAPLRRDRKFREIAEFLAEAIGYTADQELRVGIARELIEAVQASRDAALMELFLPKVVELIDYDAAQRVVEERRETERQRIRMRTDRRQDEEGVPAPRGFRRTTPPEPVPQEGAIEDR